MEGAAEDGTNPQGTCPLWVCAGRRAGRAEQAFADAPLCVSTGARVRSEWRTLPTVIKLRILVYRLHGF